ncbi:hypothetical protein [Clostridium intestinale]|nr:hypothetical protein [Clostridium intestinale]WRY50601.1 hypothetical protein P8F83_18220 [Clostridium intestinale]
MNKALVYLKFSTKDFDEKDLSIKDLEDTVKVIICREKPPVRRGNDE